MPLPGAAKNNFHESNDYLGPRNTPNLFDFAPPHGYITAMGGCFSSAGHNSKGDAEAVVAYAAPEPPPNPGTPCNWEFEKVRLL